MDEPVIELPDSPQKVLEVLRDGKFLNPSLRTGDCPSSIQHIIKYCVPALEIGRPTNKMMTVMAGESGAGKSSTINSLFNKNLCAVSSSKPGTREVGEYGSVLAVLTESPAICGILSIVDVPGTFGTKNDAEAPNLASIKRFRTDSKDLKQRPKMKVQLHSLDRNQNQIQYRKVRSAVYPNLVLMVVNSNINRLEGSDSNLRKTLKILQQCALVDPKRCNLIVVVTHALDMGRNVGRFNASFKEKAGIIREAVLEILKVKNIDVIFIENDPEKHDLQKESESDFYRLPNGELSHHNLFQAIDGLLERNGDFLGRLFCGWHFGNFERNAIDLPVTLLSSVDPQHCTEIEVEEAVEMLESLSFNVEKYEVRQHHNQSISDLNLQFIGYGFCPSAETVKNKKVFTKPKKFLPYKLSNSEIRICVPDGASVKERKETFSNMLSFETKESYESFKAGSYSLEAGVRFIASVNSKGRWVKTDEKKKHDAVVSFLYEIRLVRISVDEPDKIVSMELMAALNDLPEIWDDTKVPVFLEFFSKWGSHLVYEQWIGGSIKVDWTIESSKCDQKILSELEASVNSQFAFLSSPGTASAGANYSGGSARKSTASIKNETIHICGGNPPNVFSLQALTPEMFEQWIQSIRESPADLEHSVKLHPYYNLLKGEKYNALRGATLEYLQNSLSHVVKARREETAKKVLEKVKIDAEAKAGSGCFPHFSKVLGPNGTRIGITDLEFGQRAVILNILKSGSSLTNASFLAYLHFDPEQVTTFLEFSCSNETKLTITADHLLFFYPAAEGNILKPAQAKNVKIGDRLVFYDSSTKIVVHPTVSDITMKVIKGVYAPLTTSGTLIVDGFLVSCYADIDSHRIAHAAMTPLRIAGTCRSLIDKILTKVRNPEYPSMKQRNLFRKTGIHGYAKNLQDFRGLFAK